MKKINDRLNILLRRIGASLLTVLGFVSCSSLDEETVSEYGELSQFRAAYGVPSAAYRIKGTVKNSSGKPIPGIMVTASYSKTEFGYNNDIVYTDSKGKFLSEVRTFPTNTVWLKFQDIDGEANLGYFETQTITVTPKQVQKGDGWYQGGYEASVSVKLK